MPYFVFSPPSPLKRNRNLKSELRRENILKKNEIYHNDSVRVYVKKKRTLNSNTLRIYLVGYDETMQSGQNTNVRCFKCNPQYRVPFLSRNVEVRAIPSGYVLVHKTVKHCTGLMHFLSVFIYKQSIIIHL